MNIMFNEGNSAKRVYLQEIQTMRSIYRLQSPELEIFIELSQERAQYIDKLLPILRKIQNTQSMHDSITISEIVNAILMAYEKRLKLLIGRFESKGQSLAPLFNYILIFRLVGLFFSHNEQRLYFQLLSNALFEFSIQTNEKMTTMHLLAYGCYTKILEEIKSFKYPHEKKQVAENLKELINTLICAQDYQPNKEQFINLISQAKKQSEAIMKDTENSAQLLQFYEIAKYINNPQEQPNPLASLYSDSFFGTKSGNKLYSNIDNPMHRIALAASLQKTEEVFIMLSLCKASWKHFLTLSLA
jgi:hypothetical protein